jgi:HlyD family secretion protein
VAIGKNGAALRQLRTLFSTGTIRDLTDGQLLERFATGRGEAAELAFSVLVERHGPMVLRVCRGELADPHDTQDAFQATFLVLVRKARGLWVRDSLGPWLHQVARRTASCARSTAARRRRHERHAAAMTPEESRPRVGDDLGRVLHEEIDRLPERYRSPVVLCDLEGRTHEQAARHLGWPVGTVKSRLTRARGRLRDRLSRRGLAPNAGLFAGTSIPPALLDSTSRAVIRSVTSRAIARGSAASLAQGVIKYMIIMRCFKVASVLLALGATAAGIDALAPGQGPGPGAGPPVAEVKPGKLGVSVVERGYIEAGKVDDVHSEVEGTSTIISIVPEGSLVKKGGIVCELDSATLKDKLKNQQITVAQAAATSEQAKLTREVAEVALQEYTDAIYKQDQQTLRGEFITAESAIRKAEARLERTKLARKLVAEANRTGTKTPAEVVIWLDIEDRIDAAEMSLMHEKAALELAQSKLNRLMKYTRDRTTKELSSEVEKAKSNELAKKATFSLERDKEAKLVRQIMACVIHAPADGVVIYANDPGRTLGSINIEEGATVRERQHILRVVDLNSPMLVNAKVPEAWVDQVRLGLPVRIKVDAFANLELTGTVISIAPAPDSSTRFGTDRKVYTTRVKLADSRPGLRPGMTAEVEIVIAELDNVLSVPFAAVVSYDDKDHVAVKKPGGGFDWREVELGKSNGKVVEVKRGLNAGDVVTLDPLALMTEAEKRAKLVQPTQPASRPRR